MHINPSTHRLEDVRFVASPNCDARPHGATPDLIVIHAISLPPRQFGGDDVEKLFTNCLRPDANPAYGEIAGLRVSAHLFIRRDGETVQFVAFDRRAWHAGESCYEGRSRCNDFSVGIELEGCDESPFEDAQYRRLASVVRALTACYPTLSERRITTHAAISPGRKTDPGPHFKPDFLARHPER